MKRFFGMMPVNVIEIEKGYKDNSGLSITIQAGLHGWSVIYADGSSTFKDEDNTPEDNFKTAYDIAVRSLGNLIEVSKSRESNEVCGEICRESCGEI